MAGFFLDRVTDVDTNEATLDTKLTAVVAPWKDITGTYEMDFGKVILRPAAARRLRERGWGDFWNGVKDIAKDVADGAKDAADKVKDVAEDAADKAKEVAEDLADGAKDAADKVKDVAKNVGDAIDDAVDAVKDKGMLLTLSRTRLVMPSRRPKRLARRLKIFLRSLETRICRKPSSLMSLVARRASRRTSSPSRSGKQDRLPSYSLYANQNSVLLV
jgi:gas vesicle protein